jgi:hypothetical protein
MRKQQGRLGALTQPVWRRAYRWRRSNCRNVLMAVLSGRVARSL